MDLIITVMAFLFLIGVVITIHEGGHYWMARLTNVKILQFSIGFGKTILSKKFGKDKTLFTLKILPLGGFVIPLEKGSLPESEWNNLSDTDKQRTLTNASRSKKALIVAGGPLFNFILAFILYLLASAFIGVAQNPAKVVELSQESLFRKSGMKEGEVILQINNKPVKSLSDAFTSLANQAIKGKDTSITTDKNTYNVELSKLDLNQMDDNLGKLMGIYFSSSEGDIIVKSVNSNSPALKSGLKENDIIKSANANSINDLGKLIRIINSNPEKNIQLEVLRDNKLVMLSIVPESKPQGSSSIGKIGASFKSVSHNPLPVERYGFIESVEYSFHKVVDGSYTTLVSLGKLVTGQLAMKNISGPLAIADYSGKSAQIGLYSYITVMAAISIAVGVFNLLPIPMLDGGTLVQYAVEGIRRKNLPEKVLKNMQFVGMCLLGSMFFIAMFNDIIKYVIL